MKTLIIDNYDSFTYNLFQLVGELGGNPKVIRNDKLSPGNIFGKYTHIIISPGAGSPDDKDYFGVCEEVILGNKNHNPLLGVCLGHQGIFSAFGGKVVRAGKIRHGKTSVIEHNKRDIFKGISGSFIGMRYHSLVGAKSSTPDCLEVTALSKDDREIMGIKHKKYPIYGVQFHPESVGTEEGRKILANFLAI